MMTNKTMATMTYPDGATLDIEVLYIEDGWIGGRIPGEERIDAYPAKWCRVWGR